MDKESLPKIARISNDAVELDRPLHAHEPGAKPGESFDVDVSSFGRAGSINGERFLMDIDGEEAVVEVVEIMHIARFRRVR